MAYQAVFKRYEMKYMMTKKQRKAVLEAMLAYMKLDDFGHTTIRNVYFDTDSYILVRRSIEKPIYKEKLRIRSYKQAEAQDKVFIELKKKYDDVVYKRRESLSQLETLEWIVRETPFPKASPSERATQIGNEIEYFFQLYQTLKPKVFLSYEREAFYALDGSDFRVTFDENILARQEELSLSEGVWGESLIDEDMVLMEIKTSGGIPLWMTHVLTQEKIYKTSFSKYGTAYEKMIYGHKEETAGKAFIA
ncbi:MAG: polyphosphate polymerase domain-containing protein [Lachnospiraceae bacterium]|nr:polyphosphate polymerase domain-containing protein [Lachnospiraceae bacterium]MDE7415318.1 polyphosphate polymerase domain-containing protein [Lachnospiraceae bacterium]